MTRIMEIAGGSGAGEILRFQDIPDDWTVESGRVSRRFKDSRDRDQVHFAFPDSTRWYPAAEGAAEGDTFDPADGSVTKPPPPSAAEVRPGANQAIDHASGAARLRFTSEAAFQDTVYRLKHEQALAYRAAGYAGDVPGLVQVEVDAKGITAREAADFIIATADGWIDVVVQVETIRRQAKEGVAAASTAGEIETIVAAAVANLGEIKPG